MTPVEPLALQRNLVARVIHGLGDRIEHVRGLARVDERGGGVDEERRRVLELTLSDRIDDGARGVLVFHHRARHAFDVAQVPVAREVDGRPRARRQVEILHRRRSGRYDVPESGEPPSIDPPVPDPLPAAPPVLPPLPVDPPVPAVTLAPEDPPAPEVAVLDPVAAPLAPELVPVDPVPVVALPVAEVVGVPGPPLPASWPHPSVAPSAAHSAHPPRIRSMAG